MSDSLITKKAIAASLKELMKKKDIARISVADIAHQCGINRQTFYYHFQDKFDLINWIYYNDVISAVSEAKKVDDWSEVMLDILSDMKRDKTFYSSALKLTGQNAFQDYFFDVTKKLIAGIINILVEGKNVEEEDKTFIAEFYTFGLVGVVAQWAKNGMNETPQELVLRLKHFIDDSKYFAAARYCRDLTQNNTKLSD